MGIARKTAVCCWPPRLAPTHHHFRAAPPGLPRQRPQVTLLRPPPLIPPCAPPFPSPCASPPWPLVHALLVASACGALLLRPCSFIPVFQSGCSHFVISSVYCIIMPCLCSPPSDAHDLLYLEQHRTAAIAHLPLPPAIAHAVR